METIFPGLAAAPNIHPLVVHFPIALWLVAIVLYLVGLARDRKDLWTSAAWLLLLGTATGVLAAISGSAAEEQVGHDSPAHDLVHTHEELMLWALGCAIVATVLAITELKRPNRMLRLAAAACMVITLSMMTVGADRGALLVYGYGIGIAEEPPATEGYSDYGHSDHAGPAAAEPEAAEPGAAEPGTAEPEAAKPEAAEPGTADPEAADPAPADPAPTSDGHEAHDHGP